MRAAVIGCGRVGVATAAALAATGHRVACADSNPAVTEALRAHRLHFDEPGLHALVFSCARAGLVSFAASTADAVADADVALICVGTPESAGGAADVSQVKAAYRSVAEAREGRPGLVVATRSTVPPGTCSALAAAYGGGMRVCSNPEFLREGSALHDALHPSRVVIGSDDPAATAALCELYAPLGRPFFILKPVEAELAKYASNCFLAARVSFFNELAEICEAAGADVARVAAAAGADPRIGEAFARAGIGFGGPCLPKDLKALVSWARARGVATGVLDEVEKRNLAQVEAAVGKVAAALGGLEGKTIAVWGVAFKAGAADARESPPVQVAAAMLSSGARVRYYDPAVREPIPALEKAARFEGAYDAVRGADALMVLADWDEFRWADWGLVRLLMSGDFVFDGRNALHPGFMRALGFRYAGVGR